MTHLVMLGDSVFDNTKYINSGEPDVEIQVNHGLKKIDPDSKLTFLALDGSVNKDVRESQLKAIPDDASHVVLSIGGNDLLQLMGLLEASVDGNFGKNLKKLSELKNQFYGEYKQLVDLIDSKDLPFAVCTIYYAEWEHFEKNQRLELPEVLEWKGTDVAVDAFDAAITKVAHLCANCREVIDLRLVCDTPECYANPIEPSSFGGERIANRLIGFVENMKAGTILVDEPFKLKLTLTVFWMLQIPHCIIDLFL